MEKYVIIVAGGMGSRMNSGIPKQFIPINNKPILMHTIQNFRNFEAKMKIILVLPAEHIKLWKELCTEFHFDVEHQIVRGGKERFYSVKNGLKPVPMDALVLIHDGVRPLVSHQTIERTIEQAVKGGNAVPCVKIVDSMRKISSENSKIVSRDEYRLIQTPQVFHASLIKHAYQKRFRKNFTDDASVLESFGIKINLVEGNQSNIKITQPIDITIAEALISSELPVIL